MGAYGSWGAAAGATAEALEASRIGSGFGGFSGLVTPADLVLSTKVGFVWSTGAWEEPPMVQARPLVEVSRRISHRGTGPGGIAGGESGSG